MNSTRIDLLRLQAHEAPTGSQGTLGLRGSRRAVAAMMAEFFSRPEGVEVIALDPALVIPFTSLSQAEAVSEAAALALLIADPVGANPNRLEPSTLAELSLPDHLWQSFKALSDCAESAGASHQGEHYRFAAQEILSEAAECPVDLIPERASARMPKLMAQARLMLQRLPAEVKDCRSWAADNWGCDPNYPMLRVTVTGPSRVDLEFAVASGTMDRLAREMSRAHSNAEIHCWSRQNETGESHFVCYRDGVQFVHEAKEVPQ